ncbi:MAG: hypothetical protein IRZ08_12720, partial [Frankia sp.]|nr:hypothetical protein [Frankia sp.]
LFGPSPAAPTPADWDDDGDDDPDDGRRAGDGRPGEVEQAAGGRAADERGGGDGVREGVRHRENADPRTRGKR